MNSTDTRAAALKAYVNDMLALNKHILEAIERQAADERVKSDPRTSALISDIHRAFHGQVAAMGVHVERLGSTTGAAFKEALGHVTGIAAGLYDKVRQDPVSTMLRDDYTALNLAAYSATMLHTTALAFFDAAVAASALKQLEELTPLIIKLNELGPVIVAKELTDEGHVEAGAAEEAVRNTQAAWQK